VFAIPNGGKRDKKTAMVLKNMGVLPGVPDLMVAVPKGEYHGCFIEMKRGPDGLLSRDQEEECLELLGQGYRVIIGEGLENSWEAVCGYLNQA
jgi:hypothetical protein